jgi:hypothetical protein
MRQSNEGYHHEASRTVPRLDIGQSLVWIIIPVTSIRRYTSGDIPSAGNERVKQQGMRSLTFAICPSPGRSRWAARTSQFRFPHVVESPGTGTGKSGRGADATAGTQLGERQRGVGTSECGGDALVERGGVVGSRQSTTSKARAVPCCASSMVMGDMDGAARCSTDSERSSPSRRK